MSVSSAARPMEIRSGGPVWVRAIEPEDAGELRRAFEHLSEQSRYRRLFTGTPTLSDAMLGTLTDVDHVDQEALIASPTQDSSTIIGVARFVRYVHDQALVQAAGGSDTTHASGTVITSRIEIRDETDVVACDAAAVLRAAARLTAQAR